MKLIALVAVLVGMGCRRPLEPGETRCTSIPLGNGFSTTRCRTGQEQPMLTTGVPTNAPPPPFGANGAGVAKPAVRPRGFMCSVGAMDIGACLRTIQECERYRLEFARNCSEGSNCETTACAPRSTAFCAPSGCTTTPQACLAFERSIGRDGSACAVTE